MRSNGYAASSGERDVWAAAVAAPILSRRDQVIGSISVCGPRGRVGEAEVRSHGATVREAAARLSAQLQAGAGVDGGSAPAAEITQGEDLR